MSTDGSHISDFVKTMKARFEKCLEPSLSCAEKAINAHSVQNATALGFIAENNHVCEIRMSIRDGKPNCTFEEVGRNQASTFKGFCNNHDTEIFKPIDTEPLSLENEQQLFLLAYRSISRELHTVLEGAIRLQIALDQQIALGLVSKNAPSPAMIAATQHMMKAWGVWKHRHRYYDGALAKARFGDILHSVFTIEERPSVLAASSFFSVDQKPWGKPFSSTTLNVIPISETKTTVIFSYPKEQPGNARRYISPIILKSGEERLEELSSMIIGRAENFFMLPSHVNGWVPEKRENIEKEFARTTGLDLRNERYDSLMLF